MNIILGAALGDAVGLSCEFVSKDKIIEMFGSKIIFPYRPIRGFNLGEFTDDTCQMTFIMDTLVNCKCDRENYKYVNIALDEHLYAESKLMDNGIESLPYECYFAYLLRNWALNGIFDHKTGLGIGGLTSCVISRQRQVFGESYSGGLELLDAKR